MAKVFFQIATLLVLSLLLMSCDPACDGVMKLVNNTDSSLLVIIQKSGSFEEKYLHDAQGDSMAYRLRYEYEYNPHSISTIYGDTLLMVECLLPVGEGIELYYEGSIGTLDLNSKESGLFYLGEVLDTLYLKDSYLKKELENMDNWEIHIDKYNNGGGESLFEFIIENEDIIDK